LQTYITVLIISSFLGAFFFLCLLKAYILGLKHGKELIKGNIPKLNINPVQAVKNHIEEKEDKKVFEEETNSWNNLLSYTGEIQKEVSK
jgi:hypothetical protein